MSSIDKDNEILSLKGEVSRLNKENISLKNEISRLQENLNEKNTEISHIQKILDQLQSSKKHEEPQNISNSPPDLSRMLSRITDSLHESVPSLPPLTDLVSGPLFSFLDAYRSLETILKDASTYRDTCTSFAKQQGDLILTQDEVAAIHLYTLEWTTRQDSLYFVMNNAMRQQDRGRLKPFYPYLRLFLHALAKLPRVPMQTVLWRGVDSNLTQDYPKMEKKVWWSPSSTTRDMDVLSTFLGSGDHTLFSIQTNFGVDISKYSAFPNEAEVLLFPCVTFLVRNIFRDSNGLLIVQLEDCSTPSDFITDFDKLGTLNN